MTKVSFRGLAPRKLRTFVTALAVLLGVAFIAGSYVLTDTINKSFDEIFDVAYAGTDVAISSSTTAQGDAAAPPPFPARYLDRVREVDGVRKAEGGIFSVVRFVDAKGDQLSSSFAPEFVSSTAQKPFDTLTYVDGRPPTTADETSIDTSTADRENFKIGDTLRIAAEAGVKSYRIVGLQRLGDTSSGGSSTAQLTLPEAQRLTDKVGELDGISVQAQPGVSARLLAQRIDRVMPPRLIVETGTQAAARQSQDIKDQLELLPRDPARVRRRGAAGRQLPDLQHLLDHGRPAHPRARDAADARRDPRPDPARDDPRGRGDRHARRGARRVRRHRLRRGPERDLQELRDRPAEHRHGDRDAHGDRVAWSSGCS